MIRALKKLIPERSIVRLTWHRSKAFLAALRYGFPARKLTVIAVTGTDGKTTTVGMIAHILRSSGNTVGAASTTYLQVNDDIAENTTHLTSIDAFTLQKFLRRLVLEGCEYAVIEMSSHGLVQGRSSYTWPVVSTVTNTSLEHIEYHGSMENYQRDKGRIFRMLRAGGTKVLNRDDSSFALYENIHTSNTMTFSVSGPGDDANTLSLWISSIEADARSTSASLHSKAPDAGEATYNLSLSIPGTYNLENAMCAIGCTHAVGIPLEVSREALKTFTGMPGRMERIDEGQDFSVFVDFTMTENGYRKILQTLRAMVGESGRVLVLCSCCGNRTAQKRPLIGKVCSELADIVVVSEDETYGEDPKKVQQEVWEGVNKDVCEAQKIFDRKEAITFLMKAAEPGDAIALCGMGPFSYMQKLSGKVDWDERKVAREILQELQK